MAHVRPFCSSREVGAGGEVRWSDIQPKLAHARGDVLLILDCCYGAQAARNRIEEHLIPANVELLAACGMNNQTEPAGPTSFTTMLIKEMEASLDVNEHATVSLLHARLLQGDRGMAESSIRIALMDRKESVRIARLEQPQEYRESTSSDALSLSLHLSLEKDPTTKVLDEIGEWLRYRPPQAIIRAWFTELTSDSRSLREYIGRSRQQSSVTGFEQLSQESRKNVKALWTSLDTRLKYAESFVADITPEDIADILDSNDMSGSKRIILQEFHDLEKVILDIQRIIDRSMQAIPALKNQDLLSQAMEEIVNSGLQAEDTLRIRCSAKAPQQYGEFATSPLNVYIINDDSTEWEAWGLAHDTGDHAVFVEYKYYDREGSSQREDTINTERMNQLEAVLKAPRSEEYGTLQCLGWSSEPGKARHALHFRTPPKFQGQPVSLQALISLDDRIDRPTLGERFTIAKSISQALRKWHLAGWIHQSIASNHILFFRTAEERRVDYTRPYLCGFEYTRAVGKKSSERHPSRMTVEYDLYRHPKRQGLTSTAHSKVHDLYSFGLLLLEIGRWTTLAKDFFSKTVDRKELQRKILKRQHGLLRMQMGAAYEDAALTCIKENFGVLRDNDMQTSLAKAFEDRVLNKIADGRSIDDPRDYL